MIVHDVEMNDVGAGGEDVFNFLPEAREIGGQYRWCDQVALAHGAPLV